MLSGWDGDMDPLLEPTAFNGRKEEVGLTEVAAAWQDIFLWNISHAYI